MNPVSEQIEKIAEQLREQAILSDERGYLTDDTTALLRASGTVRMYQPFDRGGYEVTPAEFCETVMATAAVAPSAGWVAGVVGVHPWEMAISDPRLQEELWGADPDTWIASPYAPIGRARPVDGGYELTGQWPFSSGTDHCKWVVLGGMVTDEAGNLGTPPEIRHFILPRADYQIVENSWEVVGLKGTGSKDVAVNKAIVPSYRTIELEALIGGSLADNARPNHPLYALPFAVVFSYAIAAATLGITEGALGVFLNYTQGRVGSDGKTARELASRLSVSSAFSALGAASADIKASRAMLLTNAERMYDITSSGRKVSISERIEFRNDQVRACRRAVDAVDSLLSHAGGGSVRLNQPFQRYWRDAHTAMVHVCNSPELIHQGYSSDRFGGPVGEVFF